MDLMYPIPGYSFQVSFEGETSKYDANFQEISGISYEIPTEDYYEGGENRFTHRLPQPLKYPNLVLKRGVVNTSSAFFDWIKSIYEIGYADFVETRNIIVKLTQARRTKSKDSNGFKDYKDVLKTWTFVNAYPVKREISGLAAEKSELLVESIELSYQYFEEDN